MEEAAIVTGGGRGIGRAISKRLAKVGYGVAVVYREDKRSALRTCREIQRDGGDAFPIRTDLRSATAIDELLTIAESRFKGPARVLINNAAVSYKTTMATSTVDEWDDVLATDLRGPALCAKAFAARLRGRWGCVVNVVSTAAFAPLPKSPHYVAAKGGLIALTKSMALEFAPRIRVNAIAPGIVATRAHSARSAHMQRIVKQIPLGRIVRPAEVASVVLFLLDDDLCITGQTITIDGGWTLGPGVFVD